MSVIVPAYNAESLIGDQLEALAGQSFDEPFEVIVSDNGSTDATAGMARSWQGRLPGLRVIDSSDRRGPAHARNAGAAAAAGTLLAYCDADDVVAPGWLAALVRALDSADVVGGALDHDALNGRDRDVTGRIGSQDLPRPLGFLPFAISCNCAVRADVWRAVGGWSEDYPYGEDVDFSWRAQLAGYRLVFVPDAVIRYRHRGSVLALGRQVRNFARADVQLYRDYRRLGARRQSGREALRSYVYPLTRLPYLAATRRRRSLWMIVAATAWGHASGSVRYRTVFP